MICHFGKKIPSIRNTKANQNEGKRRIDGLQIQPDLQKMIYKTVQFLVLLKILLEESTSGAKKKNLVADMVRKRMPQHGMSGCVPTVKWLV